MLLELVHNNLYWNFADFPNRGLTVYLFSFVWVWVFNVIWWPFCCSHLEELKQSLRSSWEQLWLCLCDRNTRMFCLLEYLFIVRKWKKRPRGHVHKQSWEREETGHRARFHQAEGSDRCTRGLMWLTLKESSYEDLFFFSFFPSLHLQRFLHALLRSLTFLIYSCIFFSSLLDCAFSWYIVNCMTQGQFLEISLSALFF